MFLKEVRIDGFHFRWKGSFQETSVVDGTTTNTQTFMTQVEELRMVVIHTATPDGWKATATISCQGQHNLVVTKDVESLGPALQQIVE